MRRAVRMVRDHPAFADGAFRRRQAETFERASAPDAFLELGGELERIRFDTVMAFYSLFISTLGLIRFAAAYRLLAFHRDQIRRLRTLRSPVQHGLSRRKRAAYAPIVDRFAFLAAASWPVYDGRR